MRAAGGPETAKADLALAYLEMGYFEDALREAAESLVLAAAGISAAHALGVILSPRLLRENGLAVLRARLLPG